MADSALAWNWDPALGAWVAEGAGGQYRVSLSACDLDSALYRAERRAGGRVVYLGEFADPAAAEAAAEACAARAAYSVAA